MPDEGCRLLNSSVRIGVMTLAAFTAMTSVGLGEEPMPDHELSRIPVRERPHPGYEAIGYRLGPVFFSPKLTAGALYDSNVFASSDNPRSDLAMIISPTLAVRSNTSRYSYRFDVGADIFRYRELTSENRIDANARFYGQADLSRDLKVETTLEAARRHELPGDASAPRGAASPVPYNDLRADATLTRSFDRFGVAFNGNVRNLTYKDVESIEGTTLDQSWRDGTIVSTFVRSYYEFSPGYRAFVRLGGNSRNYAGTGTQNRDSRGYDVRGGLDFIITPLIFGEVGVGYLSQTYSNPDIQAISGLSFSGKATWLFTPLMTISASARRTVAETVSVNYDARIDTAFGVQVDYELLRNVILFANATRIRQDFEGAARRDDVTDIAAGIKYLMNRHMRLEARYEFLERNSSISSNSFDRHQVMFNATAQY